MVIAITPLAGSRRNAPTKKPKSGRGGAGGKNKKVVFTSKSAAMDIKLFLCVR